jgi:Glycosyltransferase WbsX
MPKFADRFAAGTPRGASLVTKDSAGRLIQWVENGFTVTITRNSVGKPAAITATMPGGGSIVWGFEYNAQGNFVKQSGEPIPTMFQDEIWRDVVSSAGFAPGNLPLSDQIAARAAVGGGYVPEFRKLGGKVAAFYYGDWRQTGLSYSRHPWRNFLGYHDRLPITAINMPSEQRWNFADGLWNWTGSNLTLEGSVDVNNSSWTGWTLGGGTLSVAAGVATIAATTDNPFFTSADALGIPVSRSTRLVLRVQSDVASDAQWDGKLYFTTDAAQTFTESKVIKIPRPPASSGPVDIIIDPSSNTLFTGVLRRLRLDFANTPGTTVKLHAVQYRPGSVRITASSADPVFVSPDNLGISGADYQRVKVRVRKIAGTAWDGKFYFTTTAATAFDGTVKVVNITEPTWDGQFKDIELDLSSKAEWTGGTLKQVRFDFGADATSIYEVQSVQLVATSSLQKFEESRVFGLPSDAQWAVDWEISTAYAHGVDVFVHNLYWNSAEAGATDGANHQRYSLDLHAQSTAEPNMQFAIQWSNHDASNPISTTAKFQALLREFNRYFGNGRYWRINGKPVVYIFSAEKLRDFSASLFGITSSPDSLKRFIDEANAYISGLADSYAPNGVHWVSQTAADQPYWMGRAEGWVGANEYAGFAAGAAYNFFSASIGQVQTSSGGTVAGTWPDKLSTFSQLSEVYRRRADWILNKSGSRLPYYAPVIAGWDKRPWWANGSASLESRDQCAPTPTEFQRHVAEAAEFAVQSAKAFGHTPVISVCAWNEYGEGSYIAPTRRYGWSLLEAFSKALPA